MYTREFLKTPEGWQVVALHVMVRAYKEWKRMWWKQTNYSEQVIKPYKYKCIKNQFRLKHLPFLFSFVRVFTFIFIVITFFSVYLTYITRSRWCRSWTVNAVRTIRCLIRHFSKIKLLPLNKSCVYLEQFIQGTPG